MVLTRWLLPALVWALASSAAANSALEEQLAEAFKPCQRYATAPGSSAGASRAGEDRNAEGFACAMTYVQGDLALGYIGLVAEPSLALYDPKPSALLVPAIGSWSDTLLHADYQSPDRLVSLQARLVVTLSGPEELSLYYVFDDGPGKTVYSDERMSFDSTKNELTWTSPQVQERGLPSGGRCATS
jgi:hypothetical protein